MSKYDCVVIGNIDYSVNERLIASDPISKKCCRRQYIPYKGSTYFYNQFFSKVMYGKMDVDEKFNLNEIPSVYGVLLANYLMEHGLKTGYLNYFNPDKESVKEVISSETATIVFDVGKATNSLPVLRVVQKIRHLNKNAKIIVHGLYIYNKWKTDTEEQFQKMQDVIGADYYVTDISCEKTILNLVRCITSGNVPRQKLWFCDEHDVSNRDFTDTDLTEWEAINLQLITDIMYLKTSRGCPACCTFCNFPIKNHNYKLEDLKQVESQMKQYQSAGVKYVMFDDDTINIPAKRFKEMLQMMIDNQFTFQWFAYCRLKELDEETVKLMALSHCAGVFVGIESVDDNILVSMKKNATVADFHYGLDLFQKYHIMTFGFFLVGFPGETKETVQKSLDFINQGKLTFFTVNLWYADVSTPIYKEAEKFGLEGKDFTWKHNTMNSLEASGYTDYIMMNAKGAVWVPNENFGFQAIPYFLSRGYSIEQIKEILNKSAQLVKNNILDEHADDEICTSELKDLLQDKCKR